MSVDFYVCDNPACGETFPDCGPYFCCNNCSSKLCDRCQDKFEAKSIDECYEYGEEIDYRDYCPFCALELVDNYDLFKFALEKLGINKEKLIEQYKKERSSEQGNNHISLSINREAL